ncbi:spore coat protein [Niallia taxi]|nr:spore coat protein [Niallia taxi]MDE5050918.1 spore coat protein [Niallia taxi]
MRIAAHEANALNELTLSCVNSITNMGYMIHHVQDPEFKSILQRHFPLHIRDYNMKVEFLNKREGATTELPLLKEEAKLNQFTEMVAPQAPPVQPRTVVENMNDREMATAYLLTLKRAGREYAWNAMEMANPEIRSFCQTAFMMSCSHAYDTWQYMVKKGYYVLEPADEMAVQKMGSMYLLVPETNPQMQAHLMNQNPIAGQSNQLYQ